jgi:hypothetical protein
VTTEHTTAPRHTRARRLVGFVAGMAAGWVLLIAGTYLGGWWMLAAGAVLWAFLVWAARGFAAPLLGLITGTVGTFALAMILWSQSSECAYEDAAGRLVVSECT